MPTYFTYATDIDMSRYEFDSEKEAAEYYETLMNAGAFKEIEIVEFEKDDNLDCHFIRTHQWDVYGGEAAYEPRLTMGDVL